MVFLSLSGFSPRTSAGYTKSRPPTNSHKPWASFVPEGTGDLCSCHLAVGHKGFVWPGPTRAALFQQQERLRGCC